jgi:MFS transporter, FHS family, L-fucose permease
MLWTIYALCFLSGANYSLLQSVLPAIQSSWSLSHGGLMAVEVAYFATLVLAAALLPRWLGRIPLPRDLGLAALVATGGAVSIFFGSSTQFLPALLTGCALLGLGSATIQIVCNAALARLGPMEQRATRFTLGQACAATGMVVAPIATAVVLQFAAHQQALQWLYAVVSLIWGLAAVWCLRINVVELSPEERQTGTPWSSWQAWVGLLVLSAYVGLEVGLVTLLVPFLAHERVLGLSANQAVTLSGVFWLGMVIGRFMGTSYIRRIGAARALVIHTIASLVCLGLAWTGSTVAAIALLATGLCNSVMYSAIWSIAVDRTGDSGKGLAGFLLLSSIGGALIPLVQGMTLDRYGLWLTLLWPLAACSCVLLFGLRALPKKLNIAE